MESRVVNQIIDAAQTVIAIHSVASQAQRSTRYALRVVCAIVVEVVWAHTKRWVDSIVLAVCAVGLCDDTGDAVVIALLADLRVGENIHPPIFAVALIRARVFDSVRSCLVRTGIASGNAGARQAIVLAAYLLVANIDISNIAVACAVPLDN